MAIFHHQDGDEPNVDYVEILAPEGRNVLRIMCQSPGDGLGDVSTSCTLDRDAVLHLHAALGEWLYPVHTPEGPNRSLIEQMIERAVKDQVAAVLPLHLSTVRIAAGLDPEPGEVGHPRPATACQCHDNDGNSIRPEPEPQLFRCRRCGASPNGAHEGCAGDARACTYIRPGDAGYDLLPEPEPRHGRLMAELPRRTRPRPEPGCVCGHGWMEHYSSLCWGGEEKYGCRCTQVRPAPAPAPVPEYCGECEHSWARHGVGAGPCNVRVPGGECGCERLRP